MVQLIPCISGNWGNVDGDGDGDGYGDVDVDVDVDVDIELGHSHSRTFDFITYFGLDSMRERVNIESLVNETPNISNMIPIYAV
jgi:hypothetical protein